LGRLPLILIFSFKILLKEYIVEIRLRDL